MAAQIADSGNGRDGGKELPFTSPLTFATGPLKATELPAVRRQVFLERTTRIRRIIGQAADGVLFFF